MDLSIPSYSTGFARCAAESENPGLWNQVNGLWDPTLGPTGLTLRDWSGYGKDGTLINGVSWVTSRYGYALGFDGINQSVECGDAVPGGDPMAISIWFRTTDNAGFLVCRSTTNAWGYGVYVNAGDKKVTLFTTTGSATITSSAVNDGAWHHLVANIKGGTCDGWLDGVLEVSGAVTGSPDGPADVSDRLAFGRQGTGSGYFIDYDLLNCAIYDGRVVAPSEIQQLYTDPHAMTRLRRRVYPAAVAPGGYTVPLSHILECAG